MEYIIKSASGIRTVSLESQLLSKRIVFLTGEINEELACNFAKQIMLLVNDNKDKPITVIVNSGGGEVTSGLMIYDIIEALTTPIKTVCLGKAYSMAGVIFACGKERLITENAEVMLHEPLISSGVGGSSSSVQTVSKRLITIKIKINKIIAKHTHHTVKKIDSDTSYDHYFQSDECVEYGLADRIVSFTEVMEELA